MPIQRDSFMRKAVQIIVIGAALAAAGIAVAQNSAPDRAIKFRQGVLNAMNWNMRFMNATIKGQRPYNKDDFLARAVYVDQLAHMPWEGFIPGSDKGAPTRARPELWKEEAKFKEYEDKLMMETAKLVTAARSGDLNQVKSPFADVDRACDSCHDDFRSK